MTLRRALPPSSALLVLLVLTSVAPAASPAPAWNIQPVAGPTNFTPGDASGTARYETFITNSGAAVTDGTGITIVDTLPKGLGVKEVVLKTPLQFGGIPDPPCETDLAGEVSTVTCTLEESLPGGKEPAKVFPTEQLLLIVHVTVLPSASGPLTNLLEVQGGGANPVTAELHNEASAADTEAGLQSLQARPTGVDGKAVTGAASHPYRFTTSFTTNLDLAPPGSSLPFLPAGGDLKGLEVALPPGLVGNLTAVKACTAQQFNSIHGHGDGEGSSITQNECPDASAVGVLNVQQFEGVGGVGRRSSVPLYNLVPPAGMPAQFGFQLAGLPTYVNTRLRSDSDYGITAYLQNLPQVKRVSSAQTTIWGVPADASHDRLRGQCALAGGTCPAGMDPRPFIRLPSSCADPFATTLRFDTWLDPGDFAESTFSEPPPTECEAPDFSPSIDAQPTTERADAPAGLRFNLHLPQAANEDSEGVGEADLRDATVTLPEGLLVNPSSADGLDGCSTGEIGLLTPVGESAASFSSAPPHCPAASKLGKVQVDTPLLGHPLPGAVYLADPFDNPFASLLAIYITVSDPRSGVVVKLPGHVVPDLRTGRLTTTVQKSPQTPFEDFQLDFFAGSRAPLRTPPICGAHTVTTSLRPWTSPASGPDATPSDSFQIAAGPNGGGCPAGLAGRPNSPDFQAGTARPLAAAYSPFGLRLARADGSQELRRLEVTLPPGLTGKLAGLFYCPDAALATAAAKSGRAELAAASCPATSQLGTVTVGAGAGASPYQVRGKAYLAGPYKGAPISMAVVTPAVAGPFDLGTVVVRAALHVDPETARISAVSDPLPTILQGIPLDLRTIDLRADRPNFTLNPTSCRAMAFSGQAISLFEQAAPLSSRFQVGGCRRLAFKPRLSLRMKGGTKRGDHPRFSATLRMKAGGANIARAQVALPRSIFLDQGNIRTICTRVQFAADDCPKGAIYGHARAWTPLLDRPLKGPVYLRSSDNLLPDLVPDLGGQIHIVLHGRTDSSRGGIRNTFEGVPDAPASKFVLSLKGGDRGLLVNSRNVCAAESRATARFTAHSGTVSEFRPLLRAQCKKRADSPRNR